MFNFYPVKVHKVRHKNDSNELTYVMSSGMHGTKNDRGEVTPVHIAQLKSEEEKYLVKLLALVSDKIRERFVNLQNCFRFLDTDHSQSISINEFAQAIDHMRLKISFDDIKKLFRYLDKKG
jgi:Ca2+-binding EF-hand superfamily protein